MVSVLRERDGVPDTDERSQSDELAELAILDLLASIEECGRLRDASKIDWLTDQLAHPRNEVRAYAATALGQIGGSRVVEPLCRVLKDADDEVRRQVVRSLRDMREPSSVKALIAALSDSDRDVRRWAARGLGLIGDPCANDALAELRNDVSVVVQDEAAQALQAIADHQALAAERSKVEGLREQRSRTDTDDLHAQARLDLQIDLEQLGIDRLQARLAGRSAALTSAEDTGET